YGTGGVRRFDHDLEAAFEKGYMTKSVHPMSICAYLQDRHLTPVLNDLIVRSSLPLKVVEDNGTFAVDSTGFGVSRFVRWFSEKYGGGNRSGHDWAKAHAICGTKTHIVTDVRVTGRDANDCPQLEYLLETTTENFRVKEVV